MSRVRITALNFIVPTVVGLTTLLILENSALTLSEHNIRDLILRDSTLRLAVLFGISYAANGGRVLQSLLAVYLYHVVGTYFSRSEDPDEEAEEDDAPQEKETTEGLEEIEEADADGTPPQEAESDDFAELKKSDGFQGTLPSSSRA
jgi:hypothetical protein